MGIRLNHDHVTVKKRDTRYDYDEKHYLIKYESVYGTHETFRLKSRNKSTAKMLAKECIGMDFEKFISIEESG